MFNPNYRFLNQTESRGGASISFPPPQIQIIPNRPKGGGEGGGSKLSWNFSTFRDTFNSTIGLNQ